MFVAVDERGEASPAIRVGHDREQYRQYLEGLPAGSQIALERAATITGWWTTWRQPATIRI